jgi:hypothetical protein
MQDQKQCQRCGEGIPLDSLYCPVCGQEQRPAVPISAPTGTPTKNKGKGWLIAILIIGVIVVCCVCIGVYLVFSYGKF